MQRMIVLAFLVVSVGMLLAGSAALAATEKGTRGDDRIYGTREDDLLVGRAGDDRLYGLAGNDTLRGGNGRDMLFARDGERDRLICGNGRDHYKRDSFDIVSEDCEREFDQVIQ